MVMVDFNAQILSMKANGLRARLTERESWKRIAGNIKATLRTGICMGKGSNTGRVLARSGD